MVNLLKVVDACKSWKTWILSTIQRLFVASDAGVEVSGVCIQEYKVDSTIL